MLHVIEDNGKSLTCKCDCGKTLELNKDKLFKRNSCGCTRGKVTLKHGESYTELYKDYHVIKRRCIVRELELGWERYEDFRDWANSNGYEIGKTLIRIDESGGYTPQNCKWKQEVC